MQIAPRREYFEHTKSLALTNELFNFLALSWFVKRFNN